MNYASIDSILLKKPYLKLVTVDTYSISKRIKELDSGYFIVFNRKTGKYEVHSTANRGWDTYCFTVPYEKLDARTLYICRKTCIATRGDLVHNEVEESNARIDAENERDFRRTLHDGSLETADMVAFGLDEDELHQGYSKTHWMGSAQAQGPAAGGEQS